MSTGTLRINRVDVPGRAVRCGELTWRDGVIHSWDDLGPEDPDLHYLAPGFVDAHVHIESSLLPPSEFARLVVRHGTVATVSDPHEIANVLGIDGVRWMLDDASRTPLTILFGASPCVPATRFETSGARLDAAAVAELLDTPGVGYVSEVMDWPSVLAGEPDMLAKLDAALSRGLPIDGHAPGVLGGALRDYASAGPSTDHECSTLAEAEEKLAAGMRVLIREGGAARNFEALHPLLTSHPGRVMLCTDDCHPSELVVGHIDRLAARAVAHGHDVFDVLTAVSLTPQEHYGLRLGALAVGDPMTAVVLRDLTDFQALATWIDGREVARDGVTLLPRSSVAPVNRFTAHPVTPEQLRLPGRGPSVRCRVIEAYDGELLTGSGIVTLAVTDGWVEPSVADDVLLLAVVNRYRPAPPALGLIRGFQLKHGALASSVAHDSHNVIGVGVDASSLALAMNAVIAHRGGLAVVRNGVPDVLPLPIAGLMSDADGFELASRAAELTTAIRTELGSPMKSPFITLSFMSLLVIPALKLSDLGLFDAQHFAFTEVASSPSS